MKTTLTVPKFIRKALKWITLFTQRDNQMDVEPNDLLLFARIVDSGSFSKAALRVDLPKSTVSRRIALLEAKLGERLLARTTRKLMLTEFGASLLEPARKVVEEVEALGTVRVGVLVCLGKDQMGVGQAAVVVLAGLGVAVLAYLMGVAQEVQTAQSALSGREQHAVSHQQIQATYKEQLCGSMNKQKAFLYFIPIFGMNSGSRGKKHPVF